MAKITVNCGATNIVVEGNATVTITVPETPVARYAEEDGGDAETREEESKGKAIDLQRIDPDFLRRLAIHESGHAIVLYDLCPHIEIEYATIVPSAEAQACVMRSDFLLIAPPDHYAAICNYLAGVAAEKLLIGDHFAGAIDDLVNATEIATTMVTKSGMGRRMGVRVFDGLAERDGESVRLANEDVNEILSACRDAVRHHLAGNQDRILRFADELLEKKRLGFPDFERILGPRQTSPIRINASPPQ